MENYTDKILQTLVDRIQTTYGIDILKKGRILKKVHLFKIFCNYVRFKLKMDGKKW